MGGAVFNPPPVEDVRRERLAKARSVSGLLSLPELGHRLRRQADHVGLAAADVVIGLCDGGNGLAECLTEKILPGVRQQVELILDFYHASEHVCGFASVWSADDESASQLAEVWCHTLKHSGGRVLLAELETLDLAGRSPLVCEERRLLGGYLGNHLDRTDSPRYRANGWQIGSGTIKSACKNIVNGRLNGTGMRWSEPGTDRLCHVRARFKSEPSAWHHYSQLHVAPCLKAQPPAAIRSHLHIFFRTMSDKPVKHRGSKDLPVTGLTPNVALCLGRCLDDVAKKIGLRVEKHDQPGRTKSA